MSPLNLRLFAVEVGRGVRIPAQNRARVGPYPRHKASATTDCQTRDRTNQRIVPCDNKSVRGFPNSQSQYMDKARFTRCDLAMGQLIGHQE